MSCIVTFLIFSSEELIGTCIVTVTILNVVFNRWFYATEVIRRQIMTNKQVFIVRVRQMNHFIHRVCVANFSVLYVEN